MTASRCASLTSTCDGFELLPVRLGLRREVFVLCAGCRRTATGMGVRIIERRVATVAVAVDRRRFVAPWRRQDLARDLTGAVLS